jgi:DNA-binding CsgD family transcriptional regulator
VKTRLARTAAPPKDLDAHVLRQGEEELVVLSFTPTGRSTLTDAEIRVAIGIAAGRSNAEIARRQGVSVRTIANHVASVLKKLGASSRNEVAARFGVDQLL